MTMRYVAPRKGIYEGMSFLKLLTGGVSPRVVRCWVSCRLGFLGILPLINRKVILPLFLMILLFVFLLLYIVYIQAVILGFAQ